MKKKLVIWIIITVIGIIGFILGLGVTIWVSLDEYRAYVYLISIPVLSVFTVWLLVAIPFLIRSIRIKRKNSSAGLNSL
ncbi:MAG: hypothetical protein ACTSQF_05460 [Candidatus Heimdallarchaeaceae archaeon]